MQGMHKVLVSFLRCKRIFTMTVAVILAALVCSSYAAELSKSDRRWLEQEVVALITDEEVRIFKELESKDDRQLFKELFLARRDPDLMTPKNEFEDEFRSRVSTANRRFKQRGRKGSASDMGIVYLLLGVPTSSDWSDPDLSVSSSMSQIMARGGSSQSRDTRFADDAPPVPFVNQEHLGLSSSQPLEINWFYDPDPQRGIPDGLALQFQAERRSGQTLIRTEELEQALARAKNSYVVNPDIRYTRDDQGRLMDLPARLNPRSPAKKALREMIEKSKKETDISFDAEAAFFRSQSGSYAPVHLEIDAKPLSWKDEEANVTLFGVVEGADGTPVRRFEEQQKLTRLEDGRVVFDIPLFLSPGRYMLNLGILDDKSGRVGTRRLPVFVPEFREDRLQLSSVLLYEGKQEALEPPGTMGHAFQFGGTRFLLRSDKTYQSNDTLGLLFFAYGYGLDHARQPNLTSEYTLIKDEQPQGRITGQPLNGDSSQAVASTGIPLADLDPGNYQVEILVTDNVTRDRITERVAFTLKPEPFPLGNYSDLVDEYRSGSFTSARNILSNVRMRSLESATKAYRKDSPSDDDLKAAALLHTDVALLSRTAEEVLHLKAARDYLARIKDISSRKGFERYWFLAVSHHLQVSSTAWSAFPMLQEALKLFPRDTEMRLAVASAYEKIGLKGVSSLLERAEELYREALESDPRHAEARLRLGRVLQLQQRGEEAVQELKLCLTHTDDDDVRLLAYMVMGASYDQIDNLPGVVESYRAALDADPNCQVAAIALGHALHRSGDRAGARNVIVDFLGRDRQAHGDGWWESALGGAARGEPILAAMRREIHSQ